MKRITTPFSPRTSSRLALLHWMTATALIAGCGGGGGDTATSGSATAPAATSSFAAGAISGFGSVIVNGVRFDNTTAHVTDDDGNPAHPEDLRLGMQVEIHGGIVSDDGTGPRAQAEDIRFGSELVGPVSAIDAAAKRLVVLGETVLVVDTTVIDDRWVGGFAAIKVGSAIEVHGTRDPLTGTLTATRIEPMAAAGGFKLRGPIASLNTAAKTFSVAGTPISYAGVANLPVGLANGLLVRVKVQTVPVAGAWVATRIDAGQPQVENAALEAAIEGSITALTSIAAFSVNGIPVDASKATFANGSSGIALGARVEVHGTSSNGVITATSVKVETQAERHAEGFELHGPLTAVNATAKTFALRGVTASYATGNVDFRKGTAAQLVVGAQVEVKGTLSADGTMLQATRISFGD